MKKLLGALGVLLLLSFSAFAETTGEPSYLFVQMAEAGKFAEDTIELENVSPVVAYFSSQPHRVAGHMKTNIFLEGWEGDNFKNDPPTALVTLFWNNATIGVVVKLSNPELEGTNLKYTAEVLEGSFPKDFRIVSIFFDPMTHYDEEIN